MNKRWSFGHLVTNMMVTTIITSGGGFDCSFWGSPPINCFGWWWSICDDNDYSHGDDHDVEMAIMAMMVVSNNGDFE